MATNNAKITVVGTGKFIAKQPFGHDSNDGLTADTPKASLSAIGTSANDENALMSGDYLVDVYTIPSVTFPCHLKADGKCILNLGGTGEISAILNHTDLHIKNGGIHANHKLLITNIYENNNCHFDSINGTVPVNSAQFAVWKNRLCKMINSQILSPNVYDFYYPGYHKCIIYGGTGIFQLRVLESSYVGLGIVIQIGGRAATVTISGDSNGTNGAASFSYNNIQGIIRFPSSGGTQDYAIQDQYTGTPQDNGYSVGVKWLTEANLTTDGFPGTIAGWDAAVATCINRDPKFNDAAAGDFTIQADSPHIGAAHDGTNIGGTDVALYVGVDENGINNTIVIVSSTIDASVPGSLKLNPGETEGYVRIIKKVSNTNVTFSKKVEIRAGYFFDTDYAGGDSKNSNVPDSQPQTLDYAMYTTTAAAGSTTSELIVPTGLLAVNDYVVVLGEIRQVTVVTPGAPNDTITVGVAFRAIVGVGVEVTFGTESKIRALNPNRPTFEWRTSQLLTPNPATDSDWDNSLDPGYGLAGAYFHMQDGLAPELYTDGITYYGNGDANIPAGVTVHQMSGKWWEVKVWLRNNYSSKGQSA